MDVTQVQEIRQVIDQVCQQYGRIDCYYNNAGIAFAGEVRDMTYDYWQRIINVNLWGVIHGVQEAYRVMIEQGAGHIVNIASMAGIVTNVHSPAYTTTKFAVVGLSNALRIEAEALGVNVSVVCPAAVNTGIRDATPYLRTDKEAFMQAMERMHKEKWYAREWDADTAARYIVSEIEKGRYLILLPPAAKMIAWIARFFPGYLNRVQRKTIEDFRRYRV
jgi:NAD(P)-dependent dehydrogenase (short-subunit alcohol dehydrogenase family)